MTPLFHPIIRPLNGTSEWIGDIVDLRVLVSVRRWIAVARWDWGDILHHGEHVFVLLLCTSDESRQPGEGYNDIWIEWMGLVEMGKELLDTMGLVLHHHQSLRTIRALTRHRKLGTVNYDVKLLCDSIIKSLFRQWWKRSHLWHRTHISILRTPSANHRRHDIISDCPPQALHLMIGSFACKNLIQHVLVRFLTCRHRIQHVMIGSLAWHDRFLEMSSSVPSCHDPFDCTRSPLRLWHSTSSNVMYWRQSNKETTTKTHYEMGDGVVDVNVKLTHRQIFISHGPFLCMSSSVPSCHGPLHSMLVSVP